MNKEKLINYLKAKLIDAQEQFNEKYEEEDFKQYLKGEIDFIKLLLIRLQDGDFD